MSATFFAEQASMTVAKFWVAVDDLLIESGSSNAHWERDLEDLYTSGVTVPVAARRVLKNRGVRL